MNFVFHHFHWYKINSNNQITYEYQITLYDRITCDHSRLIGYVCDAKITIYDQFSLDDLLGDSHQLFDQKVKFLQKSFPCLNFVYGIVSFLCKISIPALITSLFDMQ